MATPTPLTKDDKTKEKEEQVPMINEVFI